MKVKTLAVYFSVSASLMMMVLAIRALWQPGVSTLPLNKDGATVSHTKYLDHSSQLHDTVMERRQSLTNRTNIIFILADDMGLWAAGTYGNPEIHTPNIDRLAREGLKFTNAFSNTPVCSASRASILTGRLPIQNGVLDYVQHGTGCGGEGIEYLHKEITYTDILTKHSYFCALVGKHHLGYDRKIQHSFRHWYVFGRGVTPIAYKDPVMVSNSECVPVKGYTTDVIGDGAIEFLNSYAKKGSGTNPFYLSVHFTAPHPPHVGEDGRADSMHPEKYVNLYEKASFVSCPQEKPPKSGINRHSKRCHNNRECLKGYYASVTGMDVNIGRIMDTVRQLNLDQNTLIVFASDHGYNAGHHGLWGKGNAGYPLNVFETSLRIPMIWRHAGKIEPGVDESVIQVLDIAPTLLDYAGNLKFPTSTNIPGESFTDLLLRPEKRNSDSLKSRTIFGEYGATRFIRMNATIKYISRLTGAHKQLNLHEDHSQELFDLTHDQNETSNLINSKVITQEYLAELQSYEKSLQDWFAQYEDKDISSWRQFVMGNGQRRPITYAYKRTPYLRPQSYEKQAPFISSIAKYKKKQLA